MDDKLEELSIGELRRRAREREVDGCAGMSREELIEALRQADEEPAELASNQARVGDQVVDLKPPGSYAIRSEIVAAYAVNWRRGAAAALAACWKSSGRPKTRYSQCDYSPLLFGGRVLDELIERGVPAEDVFAAGIKAFSLISGTLVSEEEVREAEGFTERSEGGSTS